MSNIARYIGWPLITSGSILNLQGNNIRNGTCININKYRPQAEFDVHVNILIVFYWKYKSQVLSAKPKVVVNKSQQRSDLFFFPFFSDGLVGMAIVGGIGLGVAGLAGLIGLAVSKGAKS